MTKARIGQIATEFSIPEETASATIHFPILQEFMIALAQLNPNGWRVVIEMYVLWRSMGFSASTL